MQETRTEIVHLGRLQSIYRQPAGGQCAASKIDPEYSRDNDIQKGKRT
jgi:hypothetical protein